MTLTSWNRTGWVIVLSLCLAEFPTACTTERNPPSHPSPAILELPDGFSGWVLIRYSQPGCATSDGSEAVIKVSPHGTACTVRTRKDVWRDRSVRFAGGEWVLQASEGPPPSENLVFVWWGMGWTCEQSGAPVETFFVGTRAEYQSDRDGWQQLDCR
jgi:hypothetical protein